MIETLRDSNGNITAVIEYLMMTEEGILNDDGPVMVLAHLEINPEWRGNGAIRRFIKIILSKNPLAEKCFYIRGLKYPDRKPKMYSRKQFEKLIGE
jgi:hypothetical protein